MRDLYRYVGSKVSDAFKAEIAGVGLEVPHRNYACRGILLFINSGSPVFTGTREERIRLLQDLQREWNHKKVTRINGGAVGTVWCVVPLTEHEVIQHLRDYSRKRPPLYNLGIKWEERGNSSYISPEMVIKAETSP